MEILMRIACAFLLFGSLQAVTAGVIGDPLISRKITDSYSGYLYAYDGTFGTDGSVLSWSIYAGSNNSASQVAGHQITPVILDPNGWSIVGIGATQTIPDTGEYTFDFDLAAGTDTIGPNLTFGWYDGSSTNSNGGSISFDPATTAVGFRDFQNPAFPVLGAAYVTQYDFTGENDGNSWTAGRIYSVQFDTGTETPEPPSLAMLTGALLIAAWRWLR
jgi:hypothetical protein